MDEEECYKSVIVVCPVCAESQSKDTRGACCSSKGFKGEWEHENPGSNRFPMALTVPRQQKAGLLL